MARTQRAANTRSRDYDFSNVGKAGRRTGLTLPQQKLDEHGLEEVSQLFSSPKKPSPLKQMYTAEDLAGDGTEDSTAMTGMDSSGLTPAQTLSARKSMRGSLPRSVSPRKTGITGSARRSTGGFRAGDAHLESEEDDDADDEALVSSPSRANRSARRMSGTAPDGSPLRDITSKNRPTAPTRTPRDKQADGYSVMVSIENDYQVSDSEDEPQQDEDVAEHFVDDMAPAIDDPNDGLEPAIDDEPDQETLEDFIEVEEPQYDPPPQEDDEDADQTFTPRDGPAKTTANSRKKRRSDGELAAPASKKTKKDNKARREGKHSAVDVEEEPEMPPPKRRGRPPLKQKDKNTKMSKRQEKELDEVVAKVRARPNPPRSLYVLRKETPADDSVTLTRSGRLSVKPLAYWRNERCVWSGSPQSELKDGARFPLNSIKEIIRTEEHNSPLRRPKKGRKGQKKAKATAEDADDSSSSEEEQYTEPWETESGTIRGLVSEWDSEQGAPLNIEQEIDIAHSSQAIQTYVPQAKNGKEPAQFRYSKLFSNEFMSVGLVDLPPGGIKKPKNAQKMQMTFYVVKGRVTANVGPVFGDMTTFSVGKGGFWQVPRGNQYAIENEFGKEARLVFCQGCEVIPEAFLEGLED